MIKKLFIKHVQFTFPSYLRFSGIENRDCNHLLQFRPIWVKIGPLRAPWIFNEIENEGSKKIRKSIIKSVKKILKENGNICQEIFLCWTCRIHQILHQIFILYLFRPPVFKLIKYSRGSEGPNFDPNWSKLQ